MIRFRGVVEADYQAFLSSGGGDVEEPIPFQPALRFLRLGVVIVAGRLEVGPLDTDADGDRLVTGVRGPPGDPRLDECPLHAETGEDDDRELESLGGVDGEQLDCVVVRFVRNGLGDEGALFGLGAKPLDELAERCDGPGLAQRTGLFGDKAEAAPRFAGTRAGDREFEQLAASDDAFDEGSDADRPARSVERRECLHRVAKRRRRALRHAAKVVPPAAGVHMGEQFAILDAESR